MLSLSIFQPIRVKEQISTSHYLLTIIFYMNIIILISYFFVVNIHDAFGGTSTDSLSDLKNITITTNKNNSNYSEIILKINNLISLEKYDEALQYYDKLLAIDPSYVNALNGKGNVLKDLERYNEALQYYDRALSLDPINVDALNGQTFALANLDKSE